MCRKQFFHFSPVCCWCHHGSLVQSVHQSGGCLSGFAESGGQRSAGADSVAAAAGLAGVLQSGSELVKGLPDSASWRHLWCVAADGGGGAGLGQCGTA